MGERKRITKVIAPRVLDEFLDEQAAGARATSRSPCGSGAVAILEAHGRGGLFPEPASFARDGAETMIRSRHADVVSDLERHQQIRADEALVIEDEKFHPYKGVLPPSAGKWKVPVLLDCEETTLMLPSQRRANLDFMKKKNLAQNLIKEVYRDRRRAVETLRHRYPNGVVGVDSVYNTESSIFGEKALQLQRLEKQREESQRRRLEEISKRTNSKVARGYDPINLEVSEGIPIVECHDELYPRKKRVHDAPGKNHDTHKRLFDRNHVKPVGVRRIQAPTREFDIISGVTTS